MGELSRFIGEVGENVANVFFEKIGWLSLKKNIPLNCIRREKHKLKEGTLRTTHGIDILHSYLSQVDNNALQHVYISVKCSNDAYPNSPINTFKKHIKDLEQGMACFKRSTIKKESSDVFNGFSKQSEIGVLFWISLAKNTVNNIASKVSSCRLDNESDFGSICVVDNEVILFHLKAIDFIERKFKDGKWNYYLQETSMNYSDKSITRKTKSLPIEYLNSRVVYFVVDDHKVDEKPTFIIFTKDSFDVDVLEMYISVARELTSEMTGKYIIAFPEYISLDHSDDVNNVIRKQPANLRIDLEVVGYNESGVRGMYNE